MWSLLCIIALAPLPPVPVSTCSSYVIETPEGEFSVHCMGGCDAQQGVCEQLTLEGQTTGIQVTFCKCTGAGGAWCAGAYVVEPNPPGAPIESALCIARTCQECMQEDTVGQAGVFTTCTCLD